MEILFKKLVRCVVLDYRLGCKYKTRMAGNILINIIKNNFSKYIMLNSLIVLSKDIRSFYFQIVLLFEVKADGYIGIDNLGK